ncbi:MAG: SPFH domain-containing protein [Hydrococcus sp. Prado102]|jgi:uncharacterized membrane protein YqiK|nr:SPFH domain-containing protein [Hydrococcus sp. Prado102]
MNPQFALSLLNSLPEQQAQPEIIEVAANPTQIKPILAQTNANNDLGWLIPAGIIAGSLLTVLIAVYLLFSKFYRVCNTNEAFVISGPTRDKQVVTRATLFFPGFETITVVSLNQVTVSVVRGNTIEKPLRTKDFLKAVFNGSLQVRVNPDGDSICNAAMLLGAGKKGEKEIMVAEEEIKKRVNDILEGHLRDAASQASLGELQGSVENVTNYLKSKVEPDLARYGLQLLNIAITNIDELNHYNPENYLDIQAVVTRESIVQQNKKELEKVQEETKSEIAQMKLLETQKQLAAERELRQKQLENTLQIERMTSENEREVLQVKQTERAKQELLKVLKEQEIQEGSILSQQQLKEREIQQQQAIQEAEIAKGIAINQKNQELREREIQQQQAIQEAEIAKGIAINQKNQKLADAEKALIESQKAVSLAEVDKETAIKTAQEERLKELAKIKAQQQKETALIAKQGHLEQERLEAENQKTIAIQEAEAITTKAAAELEKALKEAEGEKAKIAAQNTLSIKALTIQLADQHMDALIANLPQVMKALAPQPGVLGTNPIILAGGQGDDNGDPTKILLATSGLTLLTKLMQNPMVTNLGKQLAQGLNADGQVPPNTHVDSVELNSLTVNKKTSPIKPTDPWDK